MRIHLLAILRGNMNEQPLLAYDPSLEPRNVRAALIWGRGICKCDKTLSAPAYLSALMERVRNAGEGFLTPARKTAVRGMLRHKTYKPSGRSKPSSEYLLTSALLNEFPLINGPVDINNAVSLECGYPASIFDLDLCGPSLRLRRGIAGESYVFNPSGQSIDLEDLLCICRYDGQSWIPCGNPVKDSMATKTNESTRNVVAIIYAPTSESVSELEAAAMSFSSLLLSDCGAAESSWIIP
jgi:DNA/RNA-binding domain of Phe-tRNA-synthetase-like protein